MSILKKFASFSLVLIAMAALASSLASRASAEDQKGPPPTDGIETTALDNVPNVNYLNCYQDHMWVLITKPLIFERGSPDAHLQAFVNFKIFSIRRDRKTHFDIYLEYPNVNNSNRIEYSTKIETCESFEIGT